MKLTKGQEVFVITNGGTSREMITPDTITKVGREYFYVGMRGDKYHIDTMCSATFGNDKVYLSLQDYEDEKEVKRLVAKIGNYMATYHYNKPLTLDQLNRIMEIINEE